MSPEFAAAIDPIFIHMVELLERIGRGQSESVDVERQSIDRCFVNAEANLGSRQDWLLAKYALVCWVDETLRTAPWEGAEWWTGNSLEFAYFKTGDAAVEFFVKAQEAAKMTRRDALEVFYICVVLGFRGLYDLSQREFLVGRLQLPPDIDGWARATWNAVRSRHSLPRFPDAAKPIRGAPPLTGRFQLVGTLLLSVILLVIAALLIGGRFYVTGGKLLW